MNIELAKWSKLQPGGSCNLPEVAVCCRLPSSPFSFVALRFPFLVVSSFILPSAYSSRLASARCRSPFAKDRKARSLRIIRPLPPLGLGDKSGERSCRA